MANRISDIRVFSFFSSAQVRLDFNLRKQTEQDHVHHPDDEWAHNGRNVRSHNEKNFTNYKSTYCRIFIKRKFILKLIVCVTENRVYILHIYYYYRRELKILNDDSDEIVLLRAGLMVLLACITLTSSFFPRSPLISHRHRDSILEDNGPGRLSRAKVPSADVFSVHSMAENAAIMCYVSRCCKLQLNWLSFAVDLAWL